MKKLLVFISATSIMLLLCCGILFVITMGSYLNFSSYNIVSWIALALYCIASVAASARVGIAIAEEEED